MVSKEEVLRIARLAKLSLTAEEEATIGDQLGRILEYVEQLRALDSESAVSADLQSSEPQAVRRDVPVEGLTREEALALAPKHDGETFLVPPVIDPGNRS